MCSLNIHDSKVAAIINCLQEHHSLVPEIYKSEDEAREAALKIICSNENESFDSYTINKGVREFDKLKGT
jgi:hypothetical protein